MDSLSKARVKFTRYSSHFAECSIPAGHYATCVLSKENNIKQFDCEKEFQALKECFHKVSKKAVK